MGNHSSRCAELLGPTTTIMPESSFKRPREDGDSHVDFRPRFKAPKKNASSDGGLAAVGGSRRGRRGDDRATYSSESRNEERVKEVSRHAQPASTLSYDDPHDSLESFTDDSASKPAPTQVHIRHRQPARCNLEPVVLTVLLQCSVRNG